MLHSKRLLLCLYILMLPFALHADNRSAAQQSEQHYFFDHYPSSWTEIAPDGGTVVVANSENYRVQAKMRMQKTHKIISNEKSSTTTSICTDKCLYIAVNGKQIIVPRAVDCDLGEPLRAKIMLKKNSAILLINIRGGDLVKIEFVKLHLWRKRVYADGSLGQDVLLQETIYHTAVYK